MEQRLQRHPLTAAEREQDRPWGSLWLWGLAAAAVAAHLLLALRASFTGGGLCFTLFDDAMISMRYAHNLARGLGFLWNVGEPPVEGYSNLLWTLWMAALHLLPLPLCARPALVTLSAALLFAGNLWIVRGITRRVGGGRVAEVAAVLLTTFKYSLVAWSAQGMEVTLASCLLDAAVLLALRLKDAPGRRDAVGLAVVLSLLVLTRDDLLLPSMGVIAFLALGARTRRAAALGGAMVALAIAGHFAFRLAYYGDLLPNTYYLKLTGIPLDIRLLRGLSSTARLTLLELALPLTLLLAVPRSWGERGGKWLFLAGLVAAQLLYSTWVGGDAWEETGFANRYLCVVEPLLAVFTGLGIQAFARASRPWRIATALGVILVLRVGVLASGTVLPRGWHLPEHQLPRIDDLPLPLLGCLGLGLAAWLLARRPRLALTALTAALLVGVEGTEWAGYWGDASVEFAREGRAALVGIELRALLPPSARVAVTWAGNLPYFNDRPAADLLGKNDHYIARLPARGEFMPGHDKWDLGYTLQTERPDVIVQLWSPTREDYDRIRAAGYMVLPNGFLAREGLQADLDSIGALPPLW